MLTLDCVDAFIISRDTRNCAEKTIKWYRIILDRLAERYPEVPLDIGEIEKFISLQPGADERRHGYYRALRAFYRFLARRYELPNPMPKMDPPRRRHKLPKALSLENFVRLMHYDHPADTEAYLEFIADTGCRVGELRNVRPSNIEHTPDGYVVLLDGKTGQRQVPLSDKAYTDILPHIPIKYNTDWLTRCISQAFRDAGVRGTAHSLRHTFCSLWNGSESALKEITGHTNMNTLEIYRHLRLSQVAREHKKYTMLNYLVKSPLRADSEAETQRT